MGSNHTKHATKKYMSPQQLAETIRVDPKVIMAIEESQMKSFPSLANFAQQEAIQTEEVRYSLSHPEMMTRLERKSFESEHNEMVRASSLPTPRSMAHAAGKTFAHSTQTCANCGLCLPETAIRYSRYAFCIGECFWSFCFRNAEETDMSVEEFQQSLALPIEFDEKSDNDSGSATSSTQASRRGSRQMLKSLQVDSLRHLNQSSRTSSLQRFPLPNDIPRFSRPINIDYLKR